MDETYLNTNAASEWLHNAIPGESKEYWRHALINNRRQDRTPPHRVPFSTLGRMAIYTLPALEAFAEFEKARRLGEMKLSARAAEAMLAFGIGQEGGSTTGRQLRVTSITAQVDETTNAPFAQLIIEDPLRVYRLDVQQARSIADELVEAITVCERAKPC